MGPGSDVDRCIFRFVPDDKPLRDSSNQVLEDADVKLQLAKYHYENGASWF